MSYVPNATIYQGTNPWVISGNVTTYGTSSSAVSTVYQAGAPWLVNASVVGTPSVNVASVVTLAIGSMPNIAVNVSQVFQGGAPWLVNASVVGVQNVNASISNVTSTGSAVPGTAGYIGFSGVSGNLTGWPGYSIGDASNAVPVVGMRAYNGTNSDSLRSLAGILATQSGVVGVPAAALIGQYNPTNITIVSSATYAYYPAQLDINGNQKVSVQGTINSNLSPQATGGYKAFFANAVTTVATVSTAVGKFGGYMIMNLNSTPAYMQIFDIPVATVITLGVNAPNFVIPLPANSTPANGLAANLEIANGIGINNSIRVGFTTTPTGSGLVTTGITGSIWYT